MPGKPVATRASRRAEPSDWPTIAQLAASFLLDAETYHEWAVRLVGGDPGWNETYWMGPLYPHLLALVYAAAGPRIVVALALQLLLILAVSQRTIATFVTRSAPARLTDFLLFLNSRKGDSRELSRATRSE